MFDYEKAYNLVSEENNRLYKRLYQLGDQLERQEVELQMYSDVYRQQKRDLLEVKRYNGELIERGRLIDIYYIEKQKLKKELAAAAEKLEQQKELEKVDLSIIDMKDKKIKKLEKEVDDLKTWIPQLSKKGEKEDEK